MSERLIEEDIEQGKERIRNILNRAREEGDTGKVVDILDKLRCARWVGLLSQKDVLDIYIHPRFRSAPYRGNESE